jgi:integration host factor subunit alpha
MRADITRDKLVLTISQTMKLSLSSARKFVDLTFARMEDGIVHDGKLMLSNFGTFSVRSKGKRIGRNPKTGEEAMITPRRVVSFSASKGLRFENTNKKMKENNEAFFQKLGETIRGSDLSRKTNK